MELSKITYEPEPGEHIQGAISSALDMAKLNDSPVNMTFNDTSIVINPTDTVDIVKTQWDIECQRRHDEHLKSEEYALRQEEYLKDMRESEAKVKNLMLSPPDFADLNSVITWLEQLADLDNISVKYEGIIELFRENEFYPNVNCKENFNKDDKENVARWLIGQALDGIQTFGAIHPIYTKFADEWRVKFL